MKNIIAFLAFVLTLSMVSCKTKEKSGSGNTEAKASCAATVSFGSSGGGIDTKTYDAIKGMIDAKKLKYTEKNMGREGEKEICLPLTELKGADKTAFIDQLKKSASSGQLVSVSAS